MMITVNNFLRTVMDLLLKNISKASGHFRTLRKPFLLTSNCFRTQIQKFSVNSTVSSDFMSENNKKKCIERLRKIIVPTVSKKKPSKQAAVLIPLCKVDSEVAILFTLRRLDLKRHRGQVSFPGGIQEEKDTDLTETALRETEEELGISRDVVDIWGQGNAVLGTEFSVLPVIGFIGDINEINIKPNPSEVDLVFTVPISHFCNPNNCKYTQFRFKNGGGYITPVYVNGTCRIWGMTAVMTHILLRALLPGDYMHDLQYIKPLTA